ncbi:TolC family outer membrane protein [Andreprevotia lacus]|uniref:TolC family outer membrane protein n=1 Tax=Andreprevotia lacus TaxID=1121000 RepID=UPI001592FBF7|nr:TolC family outer membrane protein [Andreprevotia lacus]
MLTTAYMIGLALYGWSGAAAAETLNEAAAKAISKQPELRSRFYDYRAAGEDQKAIQGRYLPRVDVTASYNHEWQTRPLTGDTDFNHPSIGVSLRQTIFDGLYTQSESRRLGYTRETRYFEVQAASDDMAVEAARAYYDVLRYRKLADLARDNYATHREIYTQIEERVKAGVGRRVDLEQAAGRMALAESNWLTEQANLYDVTARYARVIGEEPPKDLIEPGSLDKVLPKGDELLGLAIKSNPTFRAAIANIRAARARIDTQKSNNWPKLEFVASRSFDKDRDGVDGNYRDGLVGVSLNWNLFNGGTDAANTRSAAESYNGALELRDKVCRDVRQTTQSAWNNVVRLREQLAYLDQHQLSTEKARDAYRKQFDIGQRTLLDVLDSENELFDARRALTNGEYDQKVAVVRVLGQSHTLLPALKLQSLVDSEKLDDDLGDKQTADEMVGCSTNLPALGSLDKDAAMVGRPPIATLKELEKAKTDADKAKK